MLILNIVGYSFFVIIVIQFIYYGGIFSGFSTTNHNNNLNKIDVPVSVILCAKNEAENLKTFLPHIITQDYSNFEIVLINDASSDESLEVMKTFQKQHNNIKIVNVENNEAFWGNKKYALTLGIKASSYDYLLFTDADCKPVSKLWIKEMSSHFSNITSVVLGYGAYQKTKSFLNKLIRFETLMTAIQYFSYAKLGIPYMGVGRNLAYKKDEFYKANGFIEHMQIRSGDDDLFINQVANGKNTSICFSQNSFTTSLPKTSFKSWVIQKRRHISTSKYYKVKHKLLLGLFYCSQFLFWSLGTVLLITLWHWEIILTLVLLRFIVQHISLWISAKKLNEKNLIFLFPFLELFLIVSQLFIFSFNIISKPKHWK